MMINFPSNGGETPGYLARPASGSGPAVVVLQEFWGLNDDIKEIADRFAGEGYVALAVDMYHGEVATEPDEARKLAMELKMPDAGRDLSGAYDYLIGLDQVEPKKVGSVGFCMGGGLSLYLASLKPINAAVTYYGATRDPEIANQIADGIRCPVMGHFAERDSDTTERGKAAMKQLQDSGVEVELHIYPGAQHSFFNKTRPEMHHPEAAAESWQRTLAFFSKHLS